ncbi:hypothetical protein H6G20_20745 [Desertifilum sp. FACHB-1129]|uniref:Uncharacterized protein n=2 Tax=Desertifilum tharense IPPAS B-1220 TaxID=1781255 RepID=A0A1E5QL34_9CYAN|nr:MULTISPECIES: hypothetical protein [Desertifilum]MCD8489302.1 hypothetical protein [Desertifilum sp.]MDA0212094.1 hypothetical protein [Cyanobacteria bacterium FC1]MBD2314102.1 hypothetical protein [Desertifilum sp. FACHB-1129]MBD2323587.1 hypothetical protein [Desertifilum sp. FACHB-866]MBD2335039.1 hypothetical protein [Desertifilum sp. FACHB-868]
MNSIKLRLLGGGRLGYRQLIRFSTVELANGTLIVDCPLRDDAIALHQQFAEDLSQIASRLKVIQAIEIRGNGETLYSAIQLHG